MSIANLPLPQIRHRLNLMLLLGASLTLSVLLITFRVFLSHEVLFAFLLWNLFLAIIPFGLSTMLGLTAGRVKARVLLPVGAVWLLFFPNAPYILTDLFHLEPRAGAPYWYDLALILSCAWNGLMLAYASLTDMQAIVARRLGWGASWVFATVALLLSSFGIYLGRYLRFNSWDILTNPLTLFYDIINRILHPAAHLGTWGVTLLYGAFLLLGYATVRLLGRMGEEPA
ncbi:DUF1361 domain-containing protein [Hymenobacter taeanensis]|uniref:DUF1361 domain-containing protein n=1 Tax=Hymenobacter taeanensis TaxID=2735321 RepID=A0A6M6BHW9_9BACT|nr:MULTISPECIES: DUF1361 domain-containing protein [Hymenobacter]QJX48191.1 DUF1361 domain-containing protein [Hymenobacter taeanensis]UOQ82334.1 DUF1361 domain-containing protein [Hymenobacter sp. 5414T-23]